MTTSNSHITKTKRRDLFNSSDTFSCSCPSSITLSLSSSHFSLFIGNKHKTSSTLSLNFGPKNSSSTKMGNQKLETHHQFHNHHPKNTFLPMLCSKPSIKEVNLPRCRINPSSSCNDPLSPRIGCMGQVKRNNKIAGFPSSQYKLLNFNNKTISSSIISPVVKYSKLKKLFSGKNLISTPSVTSTTTITKQRVIGNNSNIQKCVRNENVVVGLRIDEMDPPLPVIKRVNKMEEGSKSDNSLWKRRSGSSGVPLRSLQLQQIQVQNPKICIQPTTV